MLVFFCNWGFFGHRTIHQLAIYQLPDDIRPFFYKNMKYIVDSSIRPDTRRSSDPTEASKHFIDLEAFGDSAAWKMPMNWESAVTTHHKDSLIKYGYVPYHIMTMKNKLTNAFRAMNKDSILYYSTDLAHYIGDANVPLHTSLNYDGQLTNQKGLHSLWESLVPEQNVESYDLHSDHKARYLSNPEQAIWDCIRRAHILLPDVFGKEIEATKEFTDSTKFWMQTRRGRTFRSFTPAFAKKYSDLLGKTVNDQLLNSSNMIADFWYTAWVDAGKPDLSSLISFDKKDKKALKIERKAWKRNQLIQKKILLSKGQAAE